MLARFCLCEVLHIVVRCNMLRHAYISDVLDMSVRHGMPARGLVYVREVLDIGATKTSVESCRVSAARQPI